MQRAKSRILETYSERHHVIPKCIGGSNKQENLVKLKPEEHYIAHQLLVKIYPSEPKLVYAMHIMSTQNNKRYGWIKRKHAKMLSSTRSGSNHPMFGKPGTMLGRIHTEEAHKKMRVPRTNKQNMKKPMGMLNPNFGKKRTEESKQKMRKPKSIGFAQGEKNPNFGKRASLETRQKMSERAKNRWRQKCL